MLGGWLFAAWRASRLLPSECTVEKVRWAEHCTLTHRTTDGVVHTMPWERCDAPTRWPRAEVGTRLPCWYYVSVPDEMVTTPQVHVWLTPFRATALGGAVVTLVVGLTLLARAGRTTPKSNESAKGSPYREPQRPTPNTLERPALTVSFRKALGWDGKLLFGGPFIGLGVALTGLLLALAWQTTGDIGIAGFLVMVFAIALTGAAVAGVGYRAGLVADHDRHRVTLWWGLWKPWFARHYALASLVHVGTDVVMTRRMRRVRLELRFANGERRLFDVDDDVEQLVDRLQTYLRADKTLAPGETSSTGAIRSTE